MQLAFCQSGYPKLIIYKGDSIVAFTPAQAKTLQIAKINCDEIAERNDSLKVQIDDALNIISLQKQALNSYDRERQLNTLLTANNEGRDKEYQNTIDNLNKQLKRRNTTNKFIGGGLIVSVGVILGLIIAN